MKRKYILQNMDNNTYYDGSKIPFNQITNENFTNEICSAFTFNTNEEAEDILEKLTHDTYGIYTINKIYIKGRKKKNEK
jgi:hypothetical protein